MIAPLTTISDTEAEPMLIGSILHDPKSISIARSIVRPEDFTDPICSLIYWAMLNLADAGQGINRQTVTGELRNRGRLQDAGGREHIDLCAESVLTGCETEQFSKRIRQLADKRNQLDALARAEKAVALDQPFSQVMAELQGVCGFEEVKSRALTLGELMTQFPHTPPPLIHGLLRIGEVMNLIGVTKSNKTWTIIALALAAASSKPRRWLGFDLRHGLRVLVVDMELLENTYWRRAELVMGGLDLTLDDLGDRLMVLCLRGEPDPLRIVEQYVTNRQIDLIILDPLFRLFGEGFDENNNAHAALLMGRLTLLARTVNAATVVVHHQPKRTTGGGSVVDAGSGAGTFARACDVHSVIEPDPTERGMAVFRAKLRTFADPPDRYLRWNHDRFLYEPESAPVVEKITVDTVLRCLADESKARAVIEAELVALGASGREAKTLTTLAIQSGRIVVDR